MTKNCTGCKKEKDLDEFSPQPTGKLGRHSKCKACHNAAAKKHWMKNKVVLMARQKIRYHESKSWVKAKYGLSKDEFNAMVEATNGLCQICHNPPSRRSLSVDHDHATGKVRGLLCERCNLAIGNMLDDPARLRAAAAYLESTLP